MNLRLLAVLVPLALGGCLSLGSPAPPVRYYLLAPLPGAEAPGPLLRVEPVELPAYLRRPQIVTRRGGTEIGRAEFDRWGEPLEENVRRVLAENLARLGAPAGRLRLEVVRFEGGEEGVALEARWALALGGAPFGPERYSAHREPVTVAGYEALAAAMSRALGALSREIAAAAAAGG